jgi:predicted ATPase
VLGGGTRAHGFNQLSLGTRRVLHILVSLIVDGSTLMLVEHPEEGIHSGLVRKLAGVLRANADPALIILSSHSADVLNALRPEDLRLVTIRRGATEAHALTAQQAGAAARFIKEEGSLAEFLESVEEE